MTLPLEKKELLCLLADNPVIASVKDESGFAAALGSSAAVLFLLFGDILSVGELTRRAHAADKAVFVHLDLVEGLAAREAAVDFIARTTAADGVLSTKPQLVRRAKALGLTAIQRFFLLDSMAFQNIEKHLGQDDPDLIEVLPGAMPKVIRLLTQRTRRPVIAGGLISDKEDVMAALSAGAVAVSSTRADIWSM